MKMQMCVDEKTDDMSRSMGAQMDKNCSKNEIKREGNRVVSESICKMGPTTATTRGIFTGDFSTAYTFETKTTYEPPMMGMREGASKGSARWTGPCKEQRLREGKRLAQRYENEHQRPQVASAAWATRCATS
jgi:hypothetical protein